MTKQTTFLSVLVALIAAIAVSACVEPSPLQPITNDPQSNEGDGRYTTCEREKPYLFKDRCDKNTRGGFTDFGKASLITSMKFPENDNPIHDFIEKVDELNPPVTVQGKIEEQISSGKFNLIFEFPEWLKDAPPQNGFPIMLWPGDKPKDGEIKIESEQEGIPSYDQGSYSASVFQNARVTPSDEEGVYDVATGSGLIKFPIFLFRVKTLLIVEGATLKAKVKVAEDGGIDILEGKIVGDVPKRSIKEGLLKLQQDCNKKRSDTCIKLAANEQSCEKQAAVDCSGDNVCELAAAACGNEDVIINRFFGTKDTKKAVVDIKGEGIKITGFQ